MAGKAELTYRTVFQVPRRRFAVVLAGTALLAAGNVLLRRGIGEALDGGEPGALLAATAALLLAVSQLLLYTRQILSAEIREDIYGRIQRKVLHGSMESLGKSDLGGIAAYYMTDVDGSTLSSTGFWERRCPTWRDGC